MRTVTKGMIVILVSALGYGTFPVLAKLALGEGLSVLPLLAWRFVLGTAFIWVFVFATGAALPSRSQLLQLAGLGALYAGDSIFYLLGLDRVSASLASVVFFSYPAATVVLARLWLGHRLTSRRIVALLLATIGSMLTVGSGLGGGDGLGILMILLAVLALATFVVLSDSGMRGVPAISGTAVFLTATTIVVVVTGLATGGLAVPMERNALILIGAIALIATAIPITLFMIGIQWIGPARAAIFSTVEPAFTLTLAAFVLGDRLSALQWVGAALIVAGVVWLRLERAAPETPH